MDSLFMIGLLVLILILIIAIAIGSYHHVNQADFKPIFKVISDGSMQMEFKDFGGLQTTRTKRFYEQYPLGMELTYQGKHYTITEIKAVQDPCVIRNNTKMVAYLNEVR